MGSERVRWTGFVGIMLVMLALIWIPHIALIRGATSGRPALRIAVGLLPLVFVPLASKVFPSSGFRAIPMKRWAIVLGLIFTAQLALELSEGWLPQNSYAANGLFAVMLVVVPLGTFLILNRKKRAVGDRGPDGTFT